MNPLTAYAAVRARMQPGDVILFDGSANSDVVDLVQHVLPNGIEVFSRSNWSHSAMLLDADQILESTIERGVSGPQINGLAERIAGYDGCNISWLPLSAAARAALDVAAGITWAQSRIGVDRYSVRTIAHYILRPALGWAIPHLRRSHPGEEVCSEYVAMAFQRMGIETLLGHPVSPNECSPETLYRWPIYADAVRLV